MLPVTATSSASDVDAYRRQPAPAAGAVKGQWRAVMDIPATALGIAAARHVVSVLLPGWALPEDVCGDAVLVVSELVTNALLHAPVTGSFELEIVRRVNGVRVSVADGSSVRPMIRELSSDLPSGRGLHVVKSLATAWGSEAHHAGKRVWVDLDSATDDGACDGHPSYARGRTCL